MQKIRKTEQPILRSSIMKEQMYKRTDWFNLELT